MLTETEVFLYLIETSEDILSSCSLPYETALKYELTREKVFKQLGLPQSSSKLWRLQHDSNRRALPKSKPDPQETPAHEYIESLSYSHETTLKYAKLLQSIIESYEKTSQNLALVIDSSVPVTQPTPFKQHELDQIYYKDLSKFKEMDNKEGKMLEMYSKQFVSLEKNLHSAVLGIEEKCAVYEKSLKNLESHVESILYKCKVERDECQSRLQELLETCHDYSEQIEALKTVNEENLNEKKLIQGHLRKNSMDFEKSAQLKEIVSKLEVQVNELTKDIVGRDKRIEKLSETLRMLEGRNVDLRKELGISEKVLREQFREEMTQLEGEASEVKRLLEQKEKDLEVTVEKVKFLQEELSSYKFNKDQEMKNKQSEIKEVLELKKKNAALKLEVKTKNSELADFNELKRKNAELKEELKNSQKDLKSLQDLKRKNSELQEELKDSQKDLKSLQDLKRKNADLQDELKSSQQDFKRKNADLQDELKTSQQDFKRKNADLKEQIKSFQYQIQDLQQLKKINADLTEELQNIQYELPDSQELQKLNSELQEEINFYRSKLSDMKEELLRCKDECLEYKEQITEMKNFCELNEGSKKVLIQVQEAVHRICEKFSNGGGEDFEDLLGSEDFSNLLNEIEYISQLVSKLANDNDWLVDRLADLGQENQRLLETLSPHHKENFSSLKSTSNALKEFENSRSKIFYKFSD